VVGCTNLKHSAILLHSTSNGHVHAVEFVAARTAKPGTSKAEIIHQKLCEADFTKLSLLFRNAHGIGKKCKPFSDYEWMGELDEKKGLNVGRNYRSDKQCRNFIAAIATVERQKLANQINDAKFVSVMSDGSMDVSAIENEIVYLCFAIGEQHSCVLYWPYCR
jgi:hypothetical protein